MTDVAYTANNTAVLLIDPYNDFIAEGGKLWPHIKAVAEKVDLHKHLAEIVNAARANGLKVFYVPHHRAEPGDYEGWKHVNATQAASGKTQVFGKGTWGGEFHDDFKPQPGDVIIKEHWAQSGFANTDLDQQLRQHGVDQIVIIGMLANSCIEATGRYGMEMGYHVTLVTDAAAAFGDEHMHAAHHVNGPTYAHAILKTEDLLRSITHTKS